VRRFLEDPVGWSRAHGGVGSLDEALARKEKAS
jgi:orotate phosphoribosyltransferase